MGRKALMVVSFGTTYPDARRAIAKLEDGLKQAFPDYDFYRAFTSGMVIRRIAQTEGIHIPTPAELLETLAAAGYTEVRCQSLHVIFGQEYEKMLEQLAPYRDRFARLEIGRPLLWDSEDYIRVAQGLRKNIPALSDDEAYVYMGHGTEHRANAAYALVETAFRCAGVERVYVGTVEGFPGLEYIVSRLKARHISRVHLAPLMIVAGDHAQNDLAGGDADSWKSLLEADGYTVETHLTGLGELDAVGSLFIDHCRMAEVPAFIRSPVFPSR